MMSSKVASSFFFPEKLPLVLITGDLPDVESNLKEQITGNFDIFPFVVSNINSLLPTGEPLIIPNCSFIYWNGADLEIPNLQCCPGSISSTIPTLVSHSDSHLPVLLETGRVSFPFTFLGMVKSEQTFWRMTVDGRWRSEWLPELHHRIWCSTNSLAIATLYLQILPSCKTKLKSWLTLAIS